MRFQLVFRTDGGDLSELHDNSEAEPHINGVLLIDGLIFTHHGHEWLAARDDHADGMQRFVCTQVRPVKADSAVFDPIALLIPQSVSSGA